MDSKKNKNSPNKWKIYAYMFDCHEFRYKNNLITGLCCAIKINQLKSVRNLEEFVAVQVSKENGFLILLKSNAKDIIVQPYKIYALAMCSNFEERLIEIKHDIIMAHADSIIESINNNAESSWWIDKG